MSAAHSLRGAGRAEGRRARARRGLSIRQPRLLLGLGVGLLASVFAFAHAAASSNLPIGAFAGLGPSFYAWRPAQLALEIAYVRRPASVSAERLFSAGRPVLASQPLNARAMRTIGWAYTSRRQPANARAAMLAAEGMSRRDAITQLWLAENSARANDLPGTLRRIDAVLRTEPLLREAQLQRVASVLTLPLARAAFQPYIRADNPWIEDLMALAIGRLPQIEPVARLVVERDRMPDTIRLRQFYVTLVQRMVDEKQLSLLPRVYRRLPGAQPATLASLALTDTQFTGGYAPLVWSLSTASDWGGAQVSVAEARDGSALDLFALPQTRGVAASKLLLLGPSGHRLAWRVFDRTPNPQAEARWQVSCLSAAPNSVAVQSANLFADNARSGELLLPANCRYALVAMEVAGGNGSNPASIVVGNLTMTAVRR